MYTCEAGGSSGAIHIERLTKDYGFVRAVNDLTIDVRRGTTVGFLGPNGAGKSTTIKILTNLINATDGFAFLNGVDVTKDPKGALADVGSVVETPEFYPYLTPRETLAYIGRLRGMSPKEIRERSKEMLELVKLEEWKDQRVGKFSKGMKQRLAIAQSLLHEPQILILDEPTSGLDPRGMVEVREILQSLKSDCYTIFMSSHLLAEVQEICDHVALIDHGRLLQYDTVENLSHMARTNVIGVDLAEAISEGTVGRLEHLESVGRVQMVSPMRILIDYNGEMSERHILLKELLDLDLKVISFNPQGLALENVYMQMIQDSR